jgi:hypothetical protein
VISDHQMDHTSTSLFATAKRRRRRSKLVTTRQKNPVFMVYIEVRVRIAAPPITSRCPRPDSVFSLPKEDVITTSQKTYRKTIKSASSCYRFFTPNHDNPLPPSLPCIPPTISSLSFLSKNRALHAPTSYPGPRLPSGRRKR